MNMRTHKDKNQSELITTLKEKRQSQEDVLSATDNNESYAPPPLHNNS